MVALLDVIAIRGSALSLPPTSRLVAQECNTVPSFPGSTQAGSWQESWNPGRRQVWQLEGSLGHHTDEGRMAKELSCTKALDKWLLTGFCVPQHLAARDLCRTQCTDSLAFLKEPQKQHQGRSPEVLQVQMSRNLIPGCWDRKPCPMGSGCHSQVEGDYGRVICKQCS